MCVGGHDSIIDGIRKIGNESEQVVPTNGNYSIRYVEVAE